MTTLVLCRKTLSPREFKSLAQNQIAKEAADCSVNADLFDHKNPGSGAYELDEEIVQIYLRKSQKHKSAGLINIFNRNISHWALMLLKTLP